MRDGRRVRKALQALQEACEIGKRGKCGNTKMRREPLETTKRGSERPERGLSNVCACLAGARKLACEARFTWNSDYCEISSRPHSSQSAYACSRASAGV